MEELILLLEQFLDMSNDVSDTEYELVLIIVMQKFLDLISEVLVDNYFSRESNTFCRAIFNDICDMRDNLQRYLNIDEREDSDFSESE